MLSPRRYENFTQYAPSPVDVDNGVVLPELPTNTSPIPPSLHSLASLKKRQSRHTSGSNELYEPLPETTPRERTIAMQQLAKQLSRTKQHPPTMLLERANTDLPPKLSARNKVRWHKFHDYDWKRLSEAPQHWSRHQATDVTYRLTEYGKPREELKESFYHPRPLNHPSNQRIAPIVRSHTLAASETYDKLHKGLRLVAVAETPHQCETSGHVQHYPDGSTLHASLQATLQTLYPKIEEYRCTRADCEEPLLDLQESAVQRDKTFNSILTDEERQRVKPERAFTLCRYLTDIDIASLHGKAEMPRSRHSSKSVPSSVNAEVGTIGPKY